ncbi:hypothetical protein [Streptomyces pratensis]|jgi:hypothetical protein|uniref:hypothetical protein n=1 Tax=Streptomyces pratensis TaxID=1169025 RepID=UPI0036369939
MRRRLLGAFVAGAAALGSGFATATPATSAPFWQAVNTDSNWSCSDYKNHRLSHNIKFKTCIVRNSSNDAQAVLVVQNSGTKAAVIHGDIGQTLTGGAHDGFYYSASCYESTLNPGFTRGCFGSTFPGTTRITATSELLMNGYDLDNRSTDSWYG